VLLFTQDLLAVDNGILPRLEILKATDGVIPTTLALALRSRHTFDGTVLPSFTDLIWSFTTATALSGAFNFGALDTNEDSFDFVVVDDTQDHDFTLSSAFTLGAVERRINGGAWSTLIAAGLTTGTILAAALNNGDTIEVRHASTDVGALKLLSMEVSAVLEAYAVLFV
jgi:hypothetical protein